MIVFAQLAAAADIPAISDEGDAVYLLESRRAREAALWYLEQMEREPASPGHLVRYLTATGRAPELRSIALLAQVEQWRDAHPDADAGLPLALALYFDDVGPHTWSSPFARGGDWCEPAAEALATLPEDPRARYDVLRARVEVSRNCGTPWEEDQRASEALALSGEAGPLARAVHGRADGVDEADLAAIEAALTAEPWALGSLTPYASPDLEGPAAEAARALVLERARAAVAEDRPSRVWVGALALNALHPDEAQAARERLQTLDPGNESNNRFVAQAEHPVERDPDAPPEPTTLLDPAARLVALQTATPPPRGTFDRIVYWGALAEAADAAGDLDAQLDALDRLWRIDPTIQSNLQFAELAADTGRRLRRGARAARHALAVQRDPSRYVLPEDRGDERRWRRILADALDASARVAEARGRTRQARDQLEEALSLAGPDPDRLLRLGNLYFDGGSADTGAPLLGRAILELPADDPRLADARARLAEHLAGSPGWAPDLDAYLAACRAPDPDRSSPSEGSTEDGDAPADPATEAPLDGSRFVDLTVVIDGKEQRLLDLEGPIVLEVWATWCWPCVQALPHVDALSREYAGRITFVAASVDDDPAVAERYLARRGDPAFVPAHLPGGQERLGISGIPATFVFDADHQLIAQLSGWGPGSRAIEEAVERVLARQPSEASIRPR